VYQGVTTVELDVSSWFKPLVVSPLNDIQNLAAETAAYLTTKHPDYAVLAARIAISNLHKETKKNFSQVVKDLYEYGKVFNCRDWSSSDGGFYSVNPKNGKAASMISKETYEIVRDNAETLDSAIIYNRDFSYN